MSYEEDAGFHCTIGCDVRLCSVDKFRPGALRAEIADANGVRFRRLRHPDELGIDGNRMSSCRVTKQVSGECGSRNALNA
jgi:hypothetical protein